MKRLPQPSALMAPGFFCGGCIQLLGGVSVNIFIFLPVFGEMIQFDSIFSNGLVKNHKLVTRLVFIWMLCVPVVWIPLFWIPPQNESGILTTPEKPQFKSPTPPIYHYHSMGLVYLPAGIVDFVW